MMRVSFTARVVLLLAVTSVATRVTARPLKIDYHSSICQKTNVGSTVTYKNDGISVASAGSVVCPLEQVTFSTDTSTTTQVTFKAWVWAKDTGAQDSSCQLVAVGPTYASIPSFPSSLGVMSGTTANFPVATATDGSPTDIHVTCDFEGSAFLGSLQVKMN